MPMNSISSRDGRLPCHEVIDGDFHESGVIHFIASLLTFVLHLIHKIFPDEISKVNVNSVIESLKHLSLRQSETINSRAFAYSKETVKSGAGKDGDDDDDEDDDDDDEEEETAKDDEELKKTGTGGDEVRESGGESEEEKETSKEEEGSFDPIPRTPEDSEKESDDEEEQDSRFSEEARIQEEEDAEELYRDVNINQGRGLQVTQSVEDTHVIITPINPDDPQESSSMSLFVSSMLNLLSDVGVESIFTTTPSQIVSLEPPTPIMTPSNIGTITTSAEAPIPPPTIPSIILENLPTFNSAFCFEERLSQKPADLSEMELKKILIEKMEGNKSIQRSDEQRNLYKALVEAYEANKTILDTYGEQKEGVEQASASTPSEKATKGACGSTTGTQSRQQSASQFAYAEEPVQTTCQMEETPLLVYETGADDQPI
nr:hypothetical protein [Tanacetum cinerariifolium]